MIRYQVEGREFLDSANAEQYAREVAETERRCVKLMEKIDDLTPWANVATYLPDYVTLVWSDDENANQQTDAASGVCR